MPLKKSSTNNPVNVRSKAGASSTSAKSDDEALEAEVTLETMPSVLFDAVAVPGGKEAVVGLGNVVEQMGELGLRAPEECSGRAR